MSPLLHLPFDLGPQAKYTLRQVVAPITRRSTTADRVDDGLPARPHGIIQVFGIFASPSTSVPHVHGPELFLFRLRVVLVVLLPPPDASLQHLGSNAPKHGFGQLNVESARFAEAEHHLRGALSRTHRKVIARIHQRVAFGLEHKSRCRHFALDDFGIDAV
jgi:hypothetical protein